VDDRWLFAHRIVSIDGEWPECENAVSPVISSVIRHVSSSELALLVGTNDAARSDIGQVTFREFVVSVVV
jgi:hypothetical protein